MISGLFCFYVVYQTEVDMNKITTIAFDADDTLWANESYFQHTETRYCELLSDYISAEDLSKELLQTEMRNISLYGFGIKSFTLSMVETALRISGNQIEGERIEKIVDYGKELLDMPIDPLPEVKAVLGTLHGRYRLVVATKGDLLDQERKLNRSGLQAFFDYVEIMSDKQVGDYTRLLARLDCQPDEFLMIGNSVKSDICPVLEIGGHAAHVPYHITWAHEERDAPITSPCFIELEKMSDILGYLNIDPELPFA